MKMIRNIIWVGTVAAFSMVSYYSGLHEVNMSHVYPFGPECSGQMKKLKIGESSEPWLASYSCYLGFIDSEKAFQPFTSGIMVTCFPNDTQPTTMTVEKKNRTLELIVKRKGEIIWGERLTIRVTDSLTWFALRFSRPSRYNYIEDALAAPSPSDLSLEINAL